MDGPLPDVVSVIFQTVRLKYIIMKPGLNWYEAKETCRSNGMQLAILNTMDKFSAAIDYFNNKG